MVETIGLRRSQDTQPSPASVAVVSAVERALLVLRAFRSGDGALTLAELADRTGLLKSTIIRLAVSLRRYCLLARLPDGRYQPDVEALRLGNRMSEGLLSGGPRGARAGKAGGGNRETASFHVRHGKKRLFLLRVEDEKPIRMHVQPDEAHPLDTSAIAQVLRRCQDGASEKPASGRSVIYTSGNAEPDAGVRCVIHAQRCPGDLWPGHTLVPGAGPRNRRAARGSRCRTDARLRGEPCPPQRNEKA